MNNEEKILAILEKMERTQERHGEILERHEKMLEQQGKTLEQQGKILEQHGKMLEQHGKMLEQHSRTLAQVQDDVTSVKVRLDLEVSKQLRVLAEGHETLLDTLASKSRVEAVEDDIILIKSAIKTMNREIMELKKAQ